MLQERLRFEPCVVVEFGGGETTVTQVRGSMLIGVMQLLREMGECERFMLNLPKYYHETATYTLAASWVAATDFLAFFDALDRTFTLESQQAQLGELLGAKITHSLFGSLLSSIRGAGSEAGIWLALKQSERMYARVYQGGGLTITQVGPKDLRHETHGLPFAASRCFQVMHAAFMRGMFLTVARACVVKKAPAARGRVNTVALAISWV